MRKPVRVLFVPATMPSHIIPLIALARQLNKELYEAAFLVPAIYHNYVRSLGFTVLNIDRHLADRTMPEMMAIGQFQPDVIVDDTSYTTAYATKMARLPRISIVRRGLMPLEQRTVSSSYQHSCPYMQNLPGKLDVVELEHGVWKPEHYSELFIGDVNIIPSIPSVETLPDQIENKHQYIYSGPLTLPDADIFGSMQHLPVSMNDNRKEVESFLNRHRDKTIVYLTMGLTFAEGLEHRLPACIQFLLNRGVAVITNTTDFKPANEAQRSLLYAAHLLPMEAVCSKATIMIHHCGSGTYNYQLSYQLPALILGTKRYDRDEVALRLQQLGAACYIPADIDDESFFTQFTQAITCLLTSTATQATSLRQLQLELAATRQHFNFPQTISNLL